MFRIIDLIPAAIRGAKHIWQHEPVRILYIVGLVANAAYEQLSGGVAVDTIIMSVAVLVLGELGRHAVTSPATADPTHKD